MSDIKVFVTFAKPGGAFFAGETLECNITFKNTSAEHTNVGSSPGIPRFASRVPPSPLVADGQHGTGVGEHRRTRTMASPNPQGREGGGGSRPPSALAHRPGLTGHKSTQSMALPARMSPNPPPSPFGTLGVPPTPDGSGKKGHRHKRSISIISIGTPEPPVEEGKRSSLPPPTRPRHGRSASLQFSPRVRPGPAGNGNLGPPATWPGKNSQPSTPMIRESAEPTINGFQFPARRASGASTGPSTPMLTPNTPITPARKPLEGFKFPALAPALEDGPPPKSETPSPDSSVPNLARKITNIDLQSHIEDSESEVAGPSASTAAFRNVNGMSDTPRSSMEFYSLANNSNDTLNSELDLRNTNMPRLMRGTHGRRHSLLSVTTPKNPETLMMGYAQVSGSFVLDGSLMQTSVFDEVKRKGVLGGQRGGGVVGIEAKKSEGSWWGLGGGLGLGVSGLTSILGGSNMSTIAEMKSIASSKSIPILSTPQSVLFIDLRLAPGESRSYSYKFPLPESLPPSHRGKAIKITYNLVIGTQRPGKGVQHPKTVEIPFRIYPFVRSDGCLFTHDLMRPIIKLHDSSSTTCLDEQPASLKAVAKRPQGKEPTMNEFLMYIDNLLGPRTSTPSLDTNMLSPSFLQPPLPTPIRTTAEDELTPKEAIEAAILGSIKGAGAGNQFDIRRSQRRVASLILARPAYKLGETVTAVLDFSNAEIPCHHLHVSLESAETVSSSLALRSASSIHRATRRIHGHYSLSTLYSQRATINLTIPSTASPDFETSGVSCVWTLRLEFITPAVSHHLEDGDFTVHKDELLDLTHSDNRGEIWEAKQQLLVESFDANIPIKVYPNPNEVGFAGGQPDPNGYVV